MININSILLKSLSLAALLGCGTAFAANGTVTGKVIGYDCAHRGETCPISRLDPHLALEPDFVLLKADGDYFFMTNLPRSTKIRHVLKDVIVSGDIDDRYRNIIV